MTYHRSFRLSQLYCDICFSIFAGMGKSCPKNDFRTRLIKCRAVNIFRTIAYHPRSMWFRLQARITKNTTLSAAVLPTHAVGRAVLGSRVRTSISVMRNPEAESRSFKVRTALSVLFSAKVPKFAGVLVARPDTLNVRTRRAG